VTYIKTYPDTVEMSDFLGFYPDEIDSDIGKYTFKINGLIFTYCIVEGWVEITIKTGGETAVEFTAECIESLKIRRNKDGEFIEIGQNFAIDRMVQIELYIRPKILLKYVSLEC
jgi:hypothetical protein